MPNDEKAVTFQSKFLILRQIFHELLFMSKQPSFLCYLADETATAAFGARLAKFSQLAHRIYFSGQLGAGKTSLIRALLRALGVQGAIKSPSYGLVENYELSERTIVHFDLYRLNSIDDFIEAGFNEFLYLENSWAFIEWPKIVMPLLTKHVCKVTIDYHSDDKRIVTFSVRE